MSVQNNPNIVKVTGTVKEINSRSFFGRNGLDDIYHYAYLIIEDMSGELMKFQRVTTNEKIDPEVDVGNRCTFYFRRIWSWKESIFHLIASESDNRGVNHFALYQTANKVSHGLMMAKAIPGAYVLGLCLFALPARFTIGLDRVRKDSIALQKELERSRIGQRFDGRELKTM